MMKERHVIAVGDLVICNKMSVGLSMDVTAMGNYDTMTSCPVLDSGGCFPDLESLFHFRFSSSLILLLFSYAQIITRLSIPLHLSFPLVINTMVNLTSTSLVHQQNPKFLSLIY